MMNAAENFAMLHYKVHGFQISLDTGAATHEVLSSGQYDKGFLSSERFP
jgi:hypothetical protein